MAESRYLVVMTRAPRLGRVKTRIARSLGDERALAIHRALVERAVGAARGAAGATVVVAHTPADAGREMRDWLGDELRYEPQRGSDLGERMAGAIATCLGQGPAHVVVIGTDAPELTAAMLDEAFDALEGRDVVIGPAADGGYYLIGMRAPHAALFRGIPWSSAETLARTLAAAREAGLRVHLLDILHDVDTADDWRAWARRSGRLLPD